MKPNRTPRGCVSALTAWALLAAAAPAWASGPVEQPAPLVQIAVLLDTSGSMSGLIDQARSQLWSIVNTFIAARQNGRRPEVQVALYEYGKSSLSQEAGWIRQIVPLTTDLDKISEELFALKTDGGDEYCGWVIRDAVKQLPWSASPEVYKAIFIAGNEPFTQGPVAYAESCKAAIARGIIVNTIHCGDQATGIDTQWQNGALLADGKYMIIDHQQAVVRFEAPQDQEIARLGVELNRTYLPFGVAGHASQERQNTQDANAVAMAPTGAPYQRAVAKASANYVNASWDLVDAVKDAKFELDAVKAEEFPEAMRSMTGAERKAHIEAKAKERAELQARINTLNAERIRYVAQKQQEQRATNALDTVMITAIREQAASKHYRFE